MLKVPICPSLIAPQQRRTNVQCSVTHRFFPSTPSHPQQPLRTLHCLQETCTPWQAKCSWHFRNGRSHSESGPSPLLWPPKQFRCLHILLLKTIRSSIINVQRNMYHLDTPNTNTHTHTYIYTYTYVYTQPLAFKDH